jgi:hypothetical protein
VTHLRKLGTLVLLLASFLTPAMACVVADVPMTPEERACCRMMHNQCGQMEMPASHGCCQKAPLTVFDRALAKNAEAQHLDLTPVISLTPPELLSADSSAIGWVEHHDFSPPQSPPSTISILRI